VLVEKLRADFTGSSHPLPTSGENYTLRDYLEWIRFRDSRHRDGRRKSPEEFLVELGDSE
jgi:hypothetical protein